MAMVMAVLLFGLMDLALGAVHADDGCELGMAYEVRGGCRLSPFAQRLQRCSDELPLDMSCDEPGGPGIALTPTYSRTVSTRGQFDRLTNAVVNAEGSGWGGHVSAGFDGLFASKVSQESVAFVVGSVRSTGSRKIRGAQLLKLAKEAKDLLSTDPRGFLDTYGHSFVYSMSHGGSFLGSCTFYASESSAKSQVKAFASLQYDGVFSAKADAKFEQMKKDSKGSVKTQIDYSIAGIKREDLIKVSSCPELMNQFVKWQKTEFDARLKMTLQPWWNVLDVQSTLRNSPNVTEDDRNLFRRSSLSAQFEKDLSLEHASLLGLQADVEAELEWAEVKESPDLTAALTQLKHDIDHRKNVVAQSTLVQLLEEQKQKLEGKPTLMAEEFLSRHDSLISKFKNRVPVFEHFRQDESTHSYSTKLDLSKDLNFPFPWHRGPVFYALDSPVDGAEQVKCVFRNNEFMFWLEELTQNSRNDGWDNCGNAFYAFRNPRKGLIPITAYRKGAGVHHFFRVYRTSAVPPPGWEKLGVAFYAYPPRPA